MKIELDNTEKKIVDATFDILQKDGIAKATTKRIAKKAGVNEVTIFRKFTNKNNLVEITKDYYIQILTEKLREIFGFTGEETFKEYIDQNFLSLLNLTESEFSIIKVTMEEVRSVSDKKRQVSQITSTVLDQMEAFFKVKIEKGEIRDVDARVLAIICISVIFEAIVLSQVYNANDEIDTSTYQEKYLDIMFNGIKIE